MDDKKIKLDKKLKQSKLNKIIKILIILIVLAVIILAVIFLKDFLSKSPEKQVIENPLKEIIQANTNAEGKINKDKLIEQAIKNFNVDYINYILISSGVNKLYKSPIGYGNPSIELVINDEIWGAEISDGNLIIKKSSTDNEDFKVYILKEQIVEALLSEDPAKFLKDSFLDGSIKAEVMASKTEILSKGYLGMYQELVN
mgnify:CR=1 FL=1